MKILTPFLLLFALTHHLEAVDEHNLTVHKLTVNGMANIKKPADQLKMTVGVVSQNADVRKAIDDNREKMILVLEAIRRAGLDAKEFQTGTFQILPQYEPPPKQPQPNWHPAIVGYEVRNTLAIETSKLDLAGPLIDAVVKQGGNLVEEIAFSLQDIQPSKKEAIAKAVAEAREYALAAAKEANVRLGDVLELTINPVAIMPRAMRMEKFAMASAETSTPITPGDVEVSASVSMIYELKK